MTHCNKRNFLTAGVEFFFFFRSEEKSIYKSYTLDIFVGLTPKSLHPRSQIKKTLFSYYKRSVKTVLQDVFITDDYKRDFAFWQIGNVAKGAIFEKFQFSMINLTMNKLPKLDELGI